MIITKIGEITDPIERFFAYAREREAIRVRRKAEVLPRPPWTDDEILQNYRFCNVFREDDKVTRWFKNHVREPMRGKPGVLLATVIFRWFNRIETGEAIFCQTDMFASRNGTAFEAFLQDGKMYWLEKAIRRYCGKGPYTTGSYMVSSPRGVDKVKGLCQCIGEFNQGKQLAAAESLGEISWREMSEILLTDKVPDTGLEFVWSWLRQFSYQGDFNSYEVVTDLRHTDLLCNASDRMTWANPGPGARRGVNRLLGRPVKSAVSRTQIDETMRELLKISKEYHWASPYRIWEMREVEHTLCEFDKYERTRLGEGRPRGVFR